MGGLATSGVKARFTGPRPGGSGEGRCGLPVHPTCRPPMQVPGLSCQLARVTKCKRDFLLNSREASFTTRLGFALRTPESHTAVTHSESAAGRGVGRRAGGGRGKGPRGEEPLRGGEAVLGRWPDTGAGGTPKQRLAAEPQRGLAVGRGVVPELPPAPPAPSHPARAL